MISISKNSNNNYLAKIVEVKGIRQHSNADRLQVVTIDFQTVITGMSTNNGDLVVFFPLECEIDSKFLSETNSFRHNQFNKNQEEKGYFEDSGRVKAQKLRGERSMGYIVPIEEVEKVYGVSNLDEHVGEEFDTIGTSIICKKYIDPISAQRAKRQSMQGKKLGVSRIVEGQVHLHADTDNFRKNVYSVKPEDLISISYKMHGTSFWVSNVLVKSKLSIKDKIAHFFGATVVGATYGLVYGSRKVIKNERETQNINNFYDTDVWGELAKEIYPVLPKGYTIYGEAVGFTSGGSSIQGDYFYGCKPFEKKAFVYRITFTNEDGVVFDLDLPQRLLMCERLGLKHVPDFYYGLASGVFPKLKNNKNWNKNFIEQLETKYTEKDCFMSTNKVPEEGIVIRKENPFHFEAYKLKSFRFLEHETEMLDKGAEDLESEN